MLQFLKKLYTPKEKIKDINVLNVDITLKLNELLNCSVNKLFFNPVSKLYIVNTYTVNFNDLLDNLYNNTFQRNLNAVNIHSYFLNSSVDIENNIEKILVHLPTLKINKLIEHDLYEIYNTFIDLKNLED